MLMTRAYHFVGATLRDDSPIPPDGEWLEFAGTCVMCKSGLHASRHPFDALQYAPGPVLCLVDCDGIAAEHDDKLVCSRRLIVARLDATEMLSAMARWSALQVIHLWDAPQVVRDYLTTGDEALQRPARSAARSAAWSAAESAARAATRSAAWYAARSAAWYGAGYAAESAAEYAAGYAAESAGESAMQAAASAATWAAACAAARAAQKTHFLDLVTAEFSKHGVTA